MHGKNNTTGNFLVTQNCRYSSLPMIYHNPNGNETGVVHVVSVLANERLVRTRQNRHFF